MAANEEQLLRNFQSSGSRDALRELLVAHQDRIYNACFQVLGRAEDAEDAAQEALLKFAEGARAARDADSFRGWTYRVAFRVALDHWRRREAVKDRESRAAMNRPAAPPLDDRERIALFEAMDGLDDRERSLLLEHYFEKVPLAQLGERRGISAVAIWKRIDRAREKLKKSLLGAGITLAAAHVSDALEATVPAAAPATLVGEAMLGKIAEGVAMTAAKGSLGPIVVLAVALSCVVGAGGYIVLRSRASAVTADPKGAANAVSPSSNAAPPGAVAATPSASPPLAPKKSRLREMLDRYKAKHLQSKATFSMDEPEGPGILDGARALILEDPATFLDFIRDPAHESLCGELINEALSVVRVIDGANIVWRQKFEELPKELTQGFLEILKSGSPGLKQAVLGFMVQMDNVPESFDVQYLALLYDTVPEVQSAAIRALTRWGSLSAPALEQMRQRYESSADPSVRATALDAIGRTDTEEVQKWMVSRIQTDRDSNMVRYVAKASLNSLMSKAGDLDARTLDRHAWALTAVANARPGKFVYYDLVLAAVQMPPSHSLPVLETAHPLAPTPELSQAVTKLMKKLRSGGTNWKEMTLEFQRLMSVK